MYKIWGFALDDISIGQMCLYAHWHEDELNLNDNEKWGWTRRAIKPESPQFFHVVQFAAIFQRFNFFLRKERI